MSSVDIDSLMQFVGYEKLQLEGFKLSKADARVKLDASAIAKGYACDMHGRPESQRTIMESGDRQAYGRLAGCRKGIAGSTCLNR